MTETLTGSVSIEKAPSDIEPLDLTGGAFEILLVPVPTEEEAEQEGTAFTRQADYYVAAKKEDESRDVAVSQSYYGEAGAAAAKYLPTVSVPKEKPGVLGLEKHMVLDCETTGTDPLQSRLVMCTLWMLGEPKSAMVTFADDDEEELTREILEYVSMRAPEWIVGYNTVFDVLFLMSRAAKYQIAAKGFYAAKIYDIMDWVKYGSSKKAGTYMKAGSLEDWALYLFGENKPFDIETCLEEYEKGNIVPFYIRNRWDTATEGDFYKLIRYLELQSEYEEAPAALKAIAGTQRQAVGTVDVQCNVCKQINVYECANEEQICFICSAVLPRPKECKV